MSIERRQTKNGVRYLARLFISEGQPRVTLGRFNKRSDAERTLELARERLADGESPEDLLRLSTMPFKDYVEGEFLPGFSGATHEDYEVSCRRLVAFFGVKPVAEITRADVRRFVGTLHDDQPNYRRKIAQRLRQILNAAVSDGLIPGHAHPYPSSVKLPAKGSNESVKTNLCIESADYILEYLRQKGEKPDDEGREGRYWYHLLLFMLRTGARRSEALGVKRRSLDYPSAQVQVWRQWNWSNSTEPFKQPKTKKSNRTIPLGRRTFDKFWAYGQSMGKDVPHDLLFARPLPGGAWGIWKSESFFSTRYKAVLRAAWEDYQERVNAVDMPLTEENFIVGSHSWRHLMATTLLASKTVDVHTVSRWLGHHSVAFTFDTYSSFVKQGEQQSADAAEEVFDWGGRAGGASSFF